MEWYDGHYSPQSRQSFKFPYGIEIKNSMKLCGKIIHYGFSSGVTCVITICTNDEHMARKGYGGILKKRFSYFNW